MENTLVLLYGACGILSAVLYLPLLHRLATQEDAWRGHSLAAWGGWFVISIVNLSYAVTINGDAKFIMAAFAGCCSLGTVNGTIMFKMAEDRIRRRRVSPVDMSHVILPSAEIEIPEANNDETGPPVHAVVA